MSMFLSCTVVARSISYPLHYLGQMHCWEDTQFLKYGSSVSALCCWTVLKKTEFTLIFFIVQETCSSCYSRFGQMYKCSFVVDCSCEKKYFYIYRFCLKALLRKYFFPSVLLLQPPVASTLHFPFWIIFLNSHLL